MANAAFGSRYSGILDALATSDESIDLAVGLLLPYSAPFMALANRFVWLGMLFAVAWVLLKVVFQQAGPNEAVGKLASVLLIFFALLPVQVSQGPFGRMPLAAYAAWQATSTLNHWYRSGIDSVHASLTGDTHALPMTMIKALNQENLLPIEETPLGPIVSDYIENCSSAVSFEAEDGSTLSVDNWRSVGLLGTGGLGFETEDAGEPPGFFMTGVLTLMSLDITGVTNIQAEHARLADWEGKRAKAKEILATKSFPGGVRSDGYMVPTEEYWKAGLDPEYTPAGLAYASVGHNPQYLSVGDEMEFRRTGVMPAVEDIHHADNCLELYELAHKGTRNYLMALREYYDVGMDVGAYRVQPEDAKMAGSAALSEAMRSFYRRSSDIANVQGEPEVKVYSHDPKDSIDTGTVWGQIMGGIHGLASLLLNINLDQWVLGAVGSISLAIAFLVITYPLFVLFTPLVGAQALILPLQVILMLGLTLMFNYVVALIGLELIAGLNIVSNNSSLGAYSMGPTTANLTVAVMTSMFVFPIFAAKLAHMIVFGSRGIGAASGQALSLALQTAAAAVILKAVAAVVTKGASLSGSFNVGGGSRGSSPGGAPGGSSGFGGSLGGSSPRPNLPGGGSPRLGSGSGANLPAPSRRSPQSGLALPPRRT